MISFIFQQIFRPPMADYDVIIQLKHHCIPRYYQSVDFTKSQNDQHEQQRGSGMPVLAFDPVQCYITELKVLHPFIPLGPPIHYIHLFTTSFISSHLLIHTIPFTQPSIPYLFISSIQFTHWFIPFHLSHPIHSTPSHPLYPSISINNPTHPFYPIHSSISYSILFIHPTNSSIPPYHPFCQSIQSNHRIKPNYSPSMH